MMPLQCHRDYQAHVINSHYVPRRYLAVGGAELLAAWRFAWRQMPESAAAQPRSCLASSIDARVFRRCESPPGRAHPASASRLPPPVTEDLHLARPTLLLAIEASHPRPSTYVSGLCARPNLGMPLTGKAASTARPRASGSWWRSVRLCLDQTWDPIDRIFSNSRNVETSRRLKLRRLLPPAVYYLHIQ